MIEDSLIYEFSCTQTKSEEKQFYTNFFICKNSASLYGKRLKDILNIKMKISENQEKTHEDKSEANYWGWFCYKNNKFTILYPSYVQLSVCFPYGIEAEENRNNGKALRLDFIEEIKETN